MSIVTPEAYENKLAAGRSIRASKAAATRRRRSASYERQAKYDAALRAYSAARQDAIANNSKLPNMTTFLVAEGL